MSTMLSPTRKDRITLNCPVCARCHEVWKDGLRTTQPLHNVIQMPLRNGSQIVRPIFFLRCEAVEFGLCSLRACAHSRRQVAATMCMHDGWFARFAIGCRREVIASYGGRAKEDSGTCGGLTKTRWRHLDIIISDWTQQKTTNAIPCISPNFEVACSTLQFVYFFLCLNTWRQHSPRTTVDLAISQHEFLHVLFIGRKFVKFLFHTLRQMSLTSQSIGRELTILWTDRWPHSCFMKTTMFRIVLGRC